LPTPGFPRPQIDGVVDECSAAHALHLFADEWRNAVELKRVEGLVWRSLGPSAVVKQRQQTGALDGSTTLKRRQDPISRWRIEAASRTHEPVPPHDISAVDGDCRRRKVTLAFLNRHI
jgi:hypothetical protein